MAPFEDAGVGGVDGHLGHRFVAYLEALFDRRNAVAGELWVLLQDLFVHYYVSCFHCCCFACMKITCKMMMIMMSFFFLIIIHLLYTYGFENVYDIACYTYYKMFIYGLFGLLFWLGKYYILIIKYDLLLEN